MLSPLKKHRDSPSAPAPASGLASSRVIHEPPVQFPPNSQSQSQSRQEKQLSQPVCPWSAYALPSGQSQSPFLRSSYSLSTSTAATGELFLFGGYSQSSRARSNDLYVVSTRDFSTTLLQTNGDIPSPRSGHCAVLTSTTLLIWGGKTQRSQSHDDSLYLLNIASREWTRIVVNGPGPGPRYYHTMTLVGSKLFVFGGKSPKRFLNDTWSFDLNRLTSNPCWESCEPTPGNVKPLPRASHVSVTTGDRIIIFGGSVRPLADQVFNDTWSFDISTRKWTELQCTGSVPTPRGSHTAVLVEDVMYVFGGRASDGTYLDDLTALNLSTQQWTAFEDIGPSPCRRAVHAMASDGRRVFVFGGKLSSVAQGAQVGEAKPIHVLDTELLVYRKPDSDIVKHGEKTTQLAQTLSTDQPQPRTLSTLDTHAVHGTPPYQNAIPGELGQNSSLNCLSSRPTGASSRPRCVPEEDDGGQGSIEHHPKLTVPDAPSGKESSRLEHGRLVELERLLSETLVAKAERDQRIAQLTDELALRRALLEQAEANAAEEKKRAGLELRELRIKFDELLLSHNQAEANAAKEKLRAGLEQRELRAKLDELLLYHDQAEANAVEEKKSAGLELRELQAKLDESLLSRDHALEQAQSALQKAAQANEQSQRELAEVHAKLEARESELAAFRSRLADTDNGWAKGKAEADTYRNQNTTGLANTDEDRVIHKLMERMQVMEAEIASLRWNEKSFEMMECRNEG